MKPQNIVITYQDGSVTTYQLELLDLHMPNEELITIEVLPESEYWMVNEDGELV